MSEGAAFSARLAAAAPVDLEERRTRCRERAYWRALAPQLGVERAALIDEEPAPEEHGALKSHLFAEGWVRAPALVPPERLAGARSAVDAVAQAGWPRVFALVYDEVWRCLKAPRMRALFGALLGPGARQLPGVWVNHVAPASGASGWGPHVDLPGPARRSRAGAPARLTGWLALTPATVDNGCLYLVPPRHAGALAERFHELESAPMSDVIRLLHGIQAVPLPPGGVALWRSDVLHWGSFATGEAATPRLGLSFELAHEAAPPQDGEEPSAALWDEVPFRRRLALIGRGLLAYGKAQEREPFAHRFLALGDDLVDLWL